MSDKQIPPKNCSEQQEFPPVFEAENLPPLRQVVEKHNLQPRKNLGQNFLFDRNITDKIARGAGGLTECTVFEIGPGPGGLTRSLLLAGAEKLIAIEFDPRAVTALEELKKTAGPRLEIHQGDALKTDLLSLDLKNTKTQKKQTCRKIVANLPYNIATPLLISWLKQIHQGLIDQKPAYTMMVLMFQKEVAERITAKPGEKNYGRLAVLCQWLCNTHTLFTLPPLAFVPPPKVESSVVRFIPRERESTDSPLHMPAFHTVEKLTAAAFGQRRKMLRSSLKNYKEEMETIGLDMRLRAEQVPVETFIALAHQVEKKD